MEQVYIYPAEFGLETPYEYSSGIYGQFKQINGLHIFKVCGEKASADHEAAEAYLDEFAKLPSRCITLMKPPFTGTTFLGRLS